MPGNSGDKCVGRAFDELLFARRPFSDFCVGEIEFIEQVKTDLVTNVLGVEIHNPFLHLGLSHFLRHIDQTSCDLRLGEA